MTKNIKVTYEVLEEKLKTYLKEEDLEVIKKAYIFADKNHFGVTRMTGEAYIDHPLNVAYILTSIKADKEAISAALMHDVLEDCDVTEEEMTELFGKEITSLVVGLTKLNKINYNGFNEAQIANHRKILVGVTEDVRVIIIKLADRLHNSRTLWVHPVKKQKEKAKETLDILTPIAHRLGMNAIKSELEDLSLRYYKPEAYFEIVEKLNKTKTERDKYIADMIESVSKVLNDNNVKHEIKGRSKGIYSIYKKLDKGKKFSDIFDLLALRIFVETESDCYVALGLIHSKYIPIPKRFKDYVAMPKTNMYQSLHTTVFGVEENLFEIQIRTKEMDQIAENGIASHWSYKEKGSNVKANIHNQMEQKLQFFQSLLELTNTDNDEELVSSIKNDILNKSVYVFTPGGDVLELPEGATPIDFAYKVHSKVGDKMVGAIVNGNIVTLDYKLKDNDIVKINTNNNSPGPSRQWVDIAVTTSAKNKIKSFFNKKDKEEYQKTGLEEFKDELKRQRINFNEFMNDENIAKILETTKTENLEDLYSNIGSNKITVGSILNIILKEVDSKEEIILKRTQNSEANIKQVHTDIVVAGIDDIKVNIASCCRPIPGDNIIGYITKGYGITVHRCSCPNLASLDKRLIDVTWDDKIDEKYYSYLVIRANKKDNLLLDIIAKTTNSNITMKNITTLEKSDNVIFDITVQVKDKETLNKFVTSLETIPSVISVERIYK